MSLPVDYSVDNILLTYLHKNTFSGCAVGYSNLIDNVFKRVFYYTGRTDKAESGVDIDGSTFFDLASLTKPLVTVLCLLALKKEGKVSFEDTISSHFTSALPADKKNIKIIDLMRHTSGFPAHRPYFNRIKRSQRSIDIEEVVQMILEEDLGSTPGERYVYSDLDYILLGYLIEKLSCESMGNFWQRKICGPLGLSKEFFWQGDTERDIHDISFAVTGVCGWSGATLCGKVHDDNCRAMNRISGHAGLFSTIKGTLTLCEELLLNYNGTKENPAYDREDLLSLLRIRKKKHWAYGFDVPTGENPSSGKFFSKRSIGHLGFTGTSFWLDLEKNRVVVILSNRVLCDDNNKNIKEMRPLLHDALLRKSLLPHSTEK